VATIKNQLSKLFVT